MSNYKHGYAVTGAARNKNNPKWRAHVAWLHMRQRCDNPVGVDIANYGGRGIRYTSEWSVFENFIRDMGDPPDGHSLDRINPNGNYSKENCRWATRKQQNSNKRRHTFIEHNGEKLLLWQWAEKLGVPQSTLRNRFYRGWAVGDVLYGRGHDV